MQRRHRTFALIVAGFVAAFVVYNAVVWELFTADFFTSRFDGGDLARMGYRSGSKDRRHNRDDLPRRHVDEDDYRGGPVDMVTLGDSFSNGIGGGLNRYYQDYIATAGGLSVLNLHAFETVDQLDQAIMLLNSGWFDRVRPRYLLVSASEKFCVERLARPRNFALLPGPEWPKLKRQVYAPPKGIDRPFGVSFINEGNFKFLLYSILYRFSDHAVIGSVCKLPLSKPLFSVKEDRTLLFYREDLKKIPLATPERIGEINDNLNRLSDLLATKGIRLVFLPCVDKYDLYSDYVVGNRYPKSRFFDELRPLSRRYLFIDSKAILAEELARGEKDIFYADDTHWSWKASKKIFETVRFR